MMEAAGIFCIIEVFFSETFLFVGMCRFSAVFAIDLDLSLHEIGDQLLEEEGKPNFTKRIKLARKFKNLIQFQVESKQ